MITLAVMEGKEIIRSPRRRSRITAGFSLTSARPRAALAGKLLAVNWLVPHRTTALVSTSISWDISRTQWVTTWRNHDLCRRRDLLWVSRSDDWAVADLVRSIAAWTVAMQGCLIITREMGWSIRYRPVTRRTVSWMTTDSARCSPPPRSPSPKWQKTVFIRVTQRDRWPLWVGCRVPVTVQDKAWGFRVRVACTCSHSSRTRRRHPCTTRAIRVITIITLPAESGAISTPRSKPRRTRDTSRNSHPSRHAIACHPFTHPLNSCITVVIATRQTQWVWTWTCIWPIIRSHRTQWSFPSEKTWVKETDWTQTDYSTKTIL